MTNLHKAPPHPTLDTGVTDIKPLSHRERDDDYEQIVVQLTSRWRVVLCPQGLQWIIQKKESSHSGYWRAEQYHTSRDSLLKACGTRDLLSDPNAEAVLHALPDRVSQLAKK